MNAGSTKKSLLDETLQGLSIIFMSFVAFLFLFHVYFKLNIKAGEEHLFRLPVYLAWRR